jgi:hypothetical protein
MQMAWATGASRFQLAPNRDVARETQRALACCPHECPRDVVTLMRSHQTWRTTHDSSQSLVGRGGALETSPIGLITQRSDPIGGGGQCNAEVSVGSTAAKYSNRGDRSRRSRSGPDGGHAEQTKIDLSPHSS